MKPSHPVLRLAILSVVSIVVATPTRSYADTYQIFNLHSDQNYFFDGMSDAGLVVLDNPVAPCGVSGCFYTFLNGASTGAFASAPVFSADNGTPCAPAVPAGGSVEHGVCNNGRDAFTGFLSSGQVFPNLYTGPGNALLTSGGEGFVYMNGLGDIVFDDHFSNTWYEAVDLTTLTPEPGSFLLLATGLLALAIPLRRRNAAFP